MIAPTGEVADPWAGLPVADRSASATPHPRAKFAELLAGNPRICVADLHEWKQSGHNIDPTTDERRAMPLTNGATHCRTDAAAHPHGTCWCGRFRPADTTTPDAETGITATEMEELQ